MERKYEITRPEFFTVELGNGKTCRGADQEWYRDEWQRKAGCGPTTAATLLAYLSATRSEFSALYPSCSCCQADFLRFMEEVWEHVTPGKLGVNSLHLFSDGVRSLAKEHKCAVHVRELDIPRFHLARPSFSQCAAFLRTGLSADCPVAFLNFSRGLVPHLESWHWVTIIAMEERPGGQAICTILDGGVERKIDFRLWYQTSHTGGGLLYIQTESKG